MLMEPRAETPPATVAALTERYLAAQLAGDRAEAVRLIVDEGLHKGVSVPDLLLNVIRPAQREIGRLWQENRVTIAEEHLATGISQLVLARLYQEMPRAAQIKKTVILACVQGETHELGARIAADFLEMAGFRVRYLGADVPTASLVEMVVKDKPDLLALSATLCFNEPALQDAVERVIKATRGALPILVGGSIVEWAPDLLGRLHKAIGADGSSGAGRPILESGSDALELVAAARRVLGLD
jgi:methanogenic corrinoid protein MtbC1